MTRRGRARGVSHEAAHAAVMKALPKAQGNPVGMEPVLKAARQGERGAIKKLNAAEDPFTLRGIPGPVFKSVIRKGDIINLAHFRAYNLTLQRYKELYATARSGGEVKAPFIRPSRQAVLSAEKKLMQAANRPLTGPYTNQHAISSFFATLHKVEVAWRQRLQQDAARMRRAVEEARTQAERDARYADAERKMRDAFRRR